MKSFEHDYSLHQPISQKLLITIRTIGEYKGKESLHKEQFPDILKTLQQIAVIQSTESSNRIEGITVPLKRALQELKRKRIIKTLSKGRDAKYRKLAH